MNAWKLVSYLLICIFALGTVSIDAQARADQISDEDVIERFKISTDGDAVYLPVTIGEKTYPFLLDTGATMTAIDRQLVNGDAPLQKRLQSTNSTIEVEVFDAPSARIGSIDLRASAPRVVGLEFKRQCEISGDECSGILGMDFLKNQIVRIDCDQGECVFLNRTQPAMGEKINLLVDRSKIPAVAVRIARPTSEYFDIDTGSCGIRASGMLMTSLCKDLIESGKAQIVGSTLGEDLAGISRSGMVQCESLKLVNFAVQKPIFRTGSRTNHLSMGFMSRFIMTFDFPNERLYLRPGKSFDAPDLCDRSGLHILRRGGKTIVHSVDQESASEVAGLREGDEILRVGDLTASQVRLLKLRELLCAEGQTVNVAARREDKEFNASLKLN